METGRLPSIQDLLNGVPHNSHDSTPTAPYGPDPSYAPYHASIQPTFDTKRSIYDSPLPSPTSSAPSTINTPPRFLTPESLPETRTELSTLIVNNSRPCTPATSTTRKRSMKRKDDSCNSCGYIHIPAPGAMYTAGLDTIRCKQRPSHPDTELLRRSINIEMKSAQLRPVDLWGDGLKRFEHIRPAMRLSATSTKSTKNDGGWSDNQTKELVARIITATTQMCEERGFTLEDIYDRMCSDSVVQQVEANAAVARRSDPIWVGHFKDIHADDQAKLLEAGFVYVDKVVKGSDASENDEDWQRPAKRAKKTTSKKDEHWLAAKL